MDLVVLAVVGFLIGIAVGDWIHAESTQYREQARRCLQQGQDSEGALYSITYWPRNSDGMTPRRHTSWLRWASAGKPPEDFGPLVESVKLVSRIPVDMELMNDCTECARAFHSGPC